ncbi:alpha/beta hydrolase [Pithovirus sibericum]|uniref:Alpha/beta hydrolase n=1 Tax=Pithovirus sibericum TaxID=1450746 RepID=W5S4D8_9VIRU|nr:alpha/beta hydrolase [Pithovirus sibericum]AHH01586.1 alpha/beta hydrolase [Pithovirus sibericum]
MLIILISLLYILYFFSKLYHRSLFNPSKKLLPKPDEVVEIRIQVDGVKLSAWRYQYDPKAPLILYFHGNNFNASTRTYAIELAKMLKMNILIPDYRGYGNSEGYPNVTDFLADSLECLCFALRTTPADKIVLWGESLGGSAASYCASILPCSKLVLLSTFCELDRLIREASFPAMQGIFFWLSPMRSCEWLEKYTGEALLIHSKNDSFIPFSHAVTNLYHLRNCSSVKLMEIDGDHSTPKFNIEQFGQLVEFLEAPFPDKKQACNWIEKISRNASSS